MFKRQFLPFAVPEIDADDINAVVATLKTGWITTGPITRQFENKFCEYLGGNLEAIAVNSATAGLHLALEACGIKEEDEVITTTLTFTATAEVIRYLGAHPKFVDIDPKTLNFDIQQIESKITAKTRAIIVVHMAGLACDMPNILKLATKYNLKVIEDAAHALPCKLNNTMIGQFNSDATIFSFYATKTITTGEGGMIVTNDKTLAKRCRTMRLHGINKDVFDRYHSSNASWYYEVIAPGFKYNLTDIASSLGISQLSKVDKFYLKRLQMAQNYYKNLADLPIILPPNVSNSSTDIHSWHLFIIQLSPESKISRDTFIQKMNEYKIGTSVHFIPLHMQPYWQQTYNLNSKDFPHATKYFKNAVSIPIYTKMNNDDQNYVIQTIHKILD